jgi:hypothetical protein
MSAKDGTDYWDGSDGYEFELSINDFGVFWSPSRRKAHHGVLPVHFDRPSGGSNPLGKAIPEGSCEGDGQDRTDD